MNRFFYNLLRVSSKKLSSARQKKAVTLLEVLISVLLMGSIVLTGASVELAMRNMQRKPTIAVRQRDELIPVIERIKKDFGIHIGDRTNTSVTMSSSTLSIRVDDGPSSFGKIAPDDSWYGYRWNGTEGDPVEYLANGTFRSNLAIGVTSFSVSAPTGDWDAALRITIGKKLIPGQAEHRVNNPGITLTTTFYSRGASLN